MRVQLWPVVSCSDLKGQRLCLEGYLHDSIMIVCFWNHHWKKWGPKKNAPWPRVSIRLYVPGHILHLGFDIFNRKSGISTKKQHETNNQRYAEREGGWNRSDLVHLSSADRSLVCFYGVVNLAVLGLACCFSLIFSHAHNYNFYIAITTINKMLIVYNFYGFFYTVAFVFLVLAFKAFINVQIWHTYPATAPCGSGPGSLDYLFFFWNCFSWLVPEIWSYVRCVTLVNIDSFS